MVDNIGPKKSDGQRPKKKAARKAEGTGPGNSGDEDEGISSARKGTGAEGTLRAEKGAGGAGTGKGEVQIQWATSDTEDV